MPRLPRNIQVWSAIQPQAIVAGVYQHGSISIATFYSWLHTVLVVTVAWQLFPADDQGHGTSLVALEPADVNILHIGDYVVLSLTRQPVEVGLTAKTFIPRTISLDISGTPRKTSFRNRIRQRDGRCCVSGDLVYDNIYASHRACHIFPIAHRDVWDLRNLSQFIQDDASESEQGPSSINSIQNGFLLRSDLHDAFDANLFAINPDDEYRIIDFTRPGKWNGSKLWINQETKPQYRPSDALLREHFRQCILANVKGAGRKSEEFMDPEDDVDLADYAHWGKPLGEGLPTRLELEIRSRLYDTALQS